jgi:DNA-binding transcriptional regulator PaaX
MIYTGVMAEDTKTIKEISEKFLQSASKAATATKFLLMAFDVLDIVLSNISTKGVLDEIAGFGMRRRYSRKQLQNTFGLLKQRKLVEIVREKNGKSKVILTNKGRKRVKEFCFEELRIQKSKRWDKKWRVLVYDIPTKPKIYNNAREALRAKIKELGFVQLQKSVWVCPYECEDEILYVAENYFVTKYVEIFTVEKMLHEDLLKKKFKL